MSNKIWNEPNMKPNAFANADGGNAGGVWGMPTVHPHGFTDANGRIRVVHTSGNVQNESPCASLVGKYQTIHGKYTHEGNATAKSSYEGQMRAILNEMHKMGCGQGGNNSASFTGCGTAIASAPTGAPDLSSKCAGGVYYTWCSGAFSPRTCQTSPYTGGRTCAWSNPNADALSIASMAQSNPVGDAPSMPMVNNNVAACVSSVCTPSPVQCSTKTNVFNTSTPMNSCGKTNSYAIGTPATLPHSCAPATAAVTPPVAASAPTPAPYVKPTFWEWLSRGMKA